MLLNGSVIKWTIQSDVTGEKHLQGLILNRIKVNENDAIRFSAATKDPKLKSGLEKKVRQADLQIENRTWRT